ncbi:peptidase M50 [Gloeomargarita lithophora Alchichica-D10]|uniref:Peptidase M50 n=1 Tax=Gloeomargarita lithophora Alchichica-D10 TaxID=1188229 RepID=A0A1J0AFU1_9CYAN|nr:site-2 protease family protein [Gloeomargarita lithophora]APB34802.1 peptidase M50 [Gloeomargarita lithophora Alchichica-D10]
MQGGIRVGALFGIPLYLDPSWFVIALLVTWGNSLRWRELYPDWPGSWVWGVGLLLALGLFGSVLLHELGHSLVAKAQGVKVRSITLFLFGGVATLERESRTPMQALRVAVAGPVVSLGLAGILGAMVWLLGGERLLLELSQAQDETLRPILTAFTEKIGLKRVVISAIAWNLASINLVLGVFNLLPGLPLDGGQVLKACIWQVTGSPFRGVQWAAGSGWILGILGMVLGVLTLFSGGIWLFLIGWFMAINAQTYRQYSVLQEMLLKTLVHQIMSREFRVLGAELCLRDFVDLYCLPAQTPEIYFAEADGRYLGLVDSGRLSRIERSQWSSASLATIVIPLDELPKVREQDNLAQAIIALGDDHAWLLVRSPVGGVQGLVLRGDVLKPLAPFLGLSGSDLERVNREGRYPQGLNLVPLAQKALEMAAALPETQH